jgi:signal transduction histidine kinase
MSVFRRLICLAVSTVVAIVSMMSLSQIAWADQYGGGSYGNCGYNTCRRAPVSTQTTLPSGLDVSINLVDGQAVPATGYTLTITPLNGQGQTFQKADMYVNGEFVYTFMPDETGTASWQWVPVHGLSAMEVAFTVAGQDGATIHKIFHITVEKTVFASVKPVAANQETSPAAYAGPLGVLKHLFNGATSTVRALPKPVAYSFPYALFGLLGLDIFLLVLQTKRELAEYRLLNRQAEHERVMSEVKKTLIALVSHYLRSPLTVLLGGVDLLPAGAAKVSLMSQLKRLQGDIEHIVGQTSQLAPAQESQVLPDYQLLRWWQPALFLPVVCIAAAAFAFDFLAVHAGTLSVSEVSVLVQSVVFMAGAIGVYQAFRRLQLRRRDARVARATKDDEALIGQTRDKLIDEAFTLLGTDMATFDSLAQATPAAVNNKFIADGQRTMHAVLNKFAIASQLKGSASTEPLRHVSADVLFATAFKGIVERAQLQKITVRQDRAATLIPARSPQLLAFALRELLSNAVAYSPTGSEIIVSARATATDTSITVADSGTGIPATKLALIVQPFYKVEGAEVFTHEGMGFGLYLSKLVMQYLGGDISFVSHPGEGTTATLHLYSVPASDAAAAPAPQLTTAPAAV